MAIGKAAASAGKPRWPLSSNNGFFESVPWLRATYRKTNIPRMCSIRSQRWQVDQPANWNACEYPNLDSNTTGSLEELDRELP